MRHGRAPRLAAVARNVYQRHAALVVAAEHIHSLALHDGGQLGMNEPRSVGHRSVRLNGHQPPLIVDPSGIGNQHGRRVGEAVQLCDAAGQHQLAVRQLIDVRVQLEGDGARPEEIKALRLFVVDVQIERVYVIGRDHLVHDEIEPVLAYAVNRRAVEYPSALVAGEYLRVRPRPAAVARAPAAYGRVAVQLGQGAVVPGGEQRAVIFDDGGLVQKAVQRRGVGHSVCFDAVRPRQALRVDALEQRHLLEHIVQRAILGAIEGKIHGTNTFFHGKNEWRTPRPSGSGKRRPPNGMIHRNSVQPAER